MARPRTVYPGLNDNEGGRPFTMDTPAVDANGEATTIGEGILDYIRRGWLRREACAIYGQHTGTIDRWLTYGARADLLLATNPNHKLTETEQKCRNFRRAYYAARANTIGDGLGIVDELGRGGRRIVETRVEREHDGADDPGRVVKSTTITKALPPRLEAVQYRLSIMDSARFSPRAVLSVTDGEAPSEDEQASVLLEALTEFIDVEGIEVEQAALPAPAPETFT